MTTERETMLREMRRMIDLQLKGSNETIEGLRTEQLTLQELHHHLVRSIELSRLLNIDIENRIADLQKSLTTPPE